MLLPIKLNDKWGYINRGGNVVVPPRFDLASDFEGSWASVKLGTKYHLLNQISRDTFLEFPMIWSVSEGCCVYSSETGTFGMVSINDDARLDPVYQSISAFYEGTSVCKYAEFFGLIDKGGNWIIPPRFDYLSSLEYCKTHITAVLNGEYLLLDRNGHRITQKSYKSLRLPGGNRVCFALEVDSTTKWGIIDLNENVVTKPIFDDCDGVITDNSVGACIQGLWGLFDGDGNVLIEPKWNYVQSFRDGLGVFGVGEDEDRLFGILDLDGNVVLDANYTEIFNLGKGLFRILTYHGIHQEELVGYFAQEGWIWDLSA
jgi:hypothetical protein